MSEPLTIERVANEDFFELVGLVDLNNESKERILIQMAQTVQENVFLRIFEQLKEDDGVQLDTLSAEQIPSFLTGKGFNVAQLLIDEMLVHRLELAAIYLEATTPEE